MPLSSPRAQRREVSIKGDAFDDAAVRCAELIQSKVVAHGPEYGRSLSEREVFWAIKHQLVGYFDQMRRQDRSRIIRRVRMIVKNLSESLGLALLSCEVVVEDAEEKVMRIREDVRNAILIFAPEATAGMKRMFLGVELPREIKTLRVRAMSRYWSARVQDPPQKKGPIPPAIPWTRSQASLLCHRGQQLLVSVPVINPDLLKNNDGPFKLRYVADDTTRRPRGSRGEVTWERASESSG